MVGSNDDDLPDVNLGCSKKLKIKATGKYCSWRFCLSVVFTVIVISNIIEKNLVMVGE